MPITSTSYSIMDKRVRAALKLFDKHRGSADKINGERLFDRDLSPMLNGDVLDFNQFHGIGVGSRVLEGNDPPMTRPAEGWRKSIKTQGYGNSIGLTSKAKDMMDDALFGLPGDLAHSKVQTCEFLMGSTQHYMLKGLATPTDEEGSPLTDSRAITGEKYFSDSHGWKGVPNVSNSNLSAAGTTLNEQSLLEMASQARKWVDRDGAPMQKVPNKLVIGLGLREKAQVILKTQYATGTANNDLNPVQFSSEGGMEIVTWSGLGDDEFMLGFPCDAASPAWYRAVYEDSKFTYSSPSGRRHVMHWIWDGIYGGINPYGYITSRADAS